VSALARFGAYAAAFEKAFETDDWSEVAPFFHEDAVYEVQLGAPFGGRFEGREAILAYFKKILDTFDRRFDAREVSLLEGPTEEGGRVWLRGRADYRLSGMQSFGFELEEIATFDGDRIRHLEDRYDAETREDVEAWLDTHGKALGIER